MNGWELTDEEVKQVYDKTMLCKMFGETEQRAIVRTNRAIVAAAQKKLVGYVLKWGRWEDSWHFILTKDKADILRDALRIKY